MRRVLDVLGLMREPNSESKSEPYTPKGRRGSIQTSTQRLSFRVLAMCLLSASAAWQPLWAASISVNAANSRLSLGSGGTGFLELSVVVTLINGTDAELINAFNASPSNFRNRIQIYPPPLSGGTASGTRPIAPTDVSRSSNNLWYPADLQVFIDATPTQVQGTTDLTLTYSARVSESGTTSILSNLASDRTITVAAGLIRTSEPPPKEKTDTTNVLASGDASIEQLIDLPNAGLDIAGIARSRRAFSVAWAAETSIPYTGGQSRAPGRVIVALFPNDEGARSFGGVNRVVDSANNTFSETLVSQGCTFTPLDGSATSGNCLSCSGGVPGSFNYVDANALSVSGVATRSVAASEGLAQFTNLPVGDTYAVAVFYDTSPVFSSCELREVKENFTLAELYGEADGKQGDARCFIATAAYGTSVHQHLDLFRWFRDRILIKLPGGDALVEQYYAWSPGLAEWIKSSAVLAAAVRMALLPWVGAVTLLQWLESLQSGLAYGTFLGLLLALMFVAVMRCVQGASILSRARSTP